MEIEKKIILLIGTMLVIYKLFKRSFSKVVEVDVKKEGILLKVARKLKHGINTSENVCNNIIIGQLLYVRVIHR